MTDSAAARIAESLRTVMKDQALNGAGLADKVEQLTGERPSPVWVSRRVGTAQDASPLIAVHPDLFVVAQALGIDRDALIGMVTDAVFGESEAVGDVDDDETRPMTAAERKAFEQRPDFPGWDAL